MIRNGAICCTSAEDVLSEYNWKEEKGKPESKYLEPLTIEEEYVFHFCQTEGEVNSEDILQHSGFSVVKLTMILLQLKGYIQETEQGRYIIKTGL